MYLCSFGDVARFVTLFRCIPGRTKDFGELADTDNHPSWLGRMMSDMVAAFLDTRRGPVCMEALINVSVCVRDGMTGVLVSVSAIEESCENYSR